MFHYFLLDAFHWSQLLQPQFYISHGGLWLILFVIFAETGLMAGFFLPGDSLLFVSGIFAHTMKDGNGNDVPGLAHQFLKIIGLGGIQNPYLDLLVLWALIAFCGILGNIVAYWFGNKTGPYIHQRKDNFLFKKRYLTQAHEFYEKNGGWAIVMARFVPIIRTFAPIVAGIVGMNKSKFMYFNILGSVAWVFLMLFGGFFLQKWILNAFNFDLKEHLEVIVLGIVLVTTLPVIIKLAGGKKKGN